MLGDLDTRTQELNEGITFHLLPGTGESASLAVMVRETGIEITSDSESIQQIYETNSNT